MHVMFEYLTKFVKTEHMCHSNKLNYFALRWLGALVFKMKLIYVPDLGLSEWI